MPTTITYTAEAYQFPDDPALTQDRRYKIIKTTNTDGVITVEQEGLARIAANPTEEADPLCRTVVDPQDDAGVQQLKLLIVAPPPVPRTP